MPIRPTRRSVLLGTGALPFATRRAAAQAQDWPNRPVTVVVPWAAGGSTDVMVRVVLHRMSADLGQPFVVDNRAGATGTVGHAWVARQRPDGYTLLAATNSTYAIAPHLYASLPYDNERAFTPITQLATNPQMLCVHPSVPVRNFAEFLAYARARPGEIPFGTSGIGGTSHLATELLMAMTGIQMLHVPYRGGGPAAQAIVAGETKVTFVDVITAVPFLRGGQLRALAVSTTERSPLVPDVPTIAEAGVPSYQSVGWGGMLAPRGTPSATMARLMDKLAAIMALAAVQQQLVKIGVEPSVLLGAEFEQFMREDLERFGIAARAANLKPN